MTIGSSGSRRRSRSVVLNAGALALGLAFTGVGSAMAQASSSTFTDLLITQDGTQQFFDSKGANPTGAKANSVQVNTPKNGIFPDGTVINNDGLSTAKAFAPNQLLATSVSGDIDRASGQGTTTILAQSVSTIADRLTISSLDATDHQLVTLHKILTLTETTNFADVLNNLTHGHIDTDLAATLKITAGDNNGSLIGSGPLGNDIFASLHLTSDGESQNQDFLHAPKFIDFSMSMDLNTADAFTISMFDDAFASVDNVDGRENEFASFGLSHTLNFASGVTVTDAAGNAMCGLRISAASGLNFGTIDACSSTGDGGAGGAGGVPEPASWALMIGGLGGAGALLRRRRRLQPA